LTCRYASTSHLPVCLNLCQSSPILTLLFRFLGANKQYDSDEEYEGMLRLIVHSDPQKAIIWQFVTVCNRTYLVVKENRDEAAKDTAGWYVAVPPDSKRDRKSHYLAISPQVRDAMPVSAVPAVPDSLP